MKRYFIFCLMALFSIVLFSSCITTDSVEVTEEYVVTHGIPYYRHGIVVYYRLGELYYYIEDRNGVHHLRARRYPLQPAYRYNRRPLPPRHPNRPLPPPRYGNRRFGR